PQYTRLGRVARRRLSKTLNSTSLGTVLNADTMCARRAFFARASAPDDVWAIASSLSSLVIGMEQLTMTLPETLTVCFSTSLTRDQCTASRIASASCTASGGVPG